MRWFKLYIYCLHIWYTLCKCIGGGRLQAVCTTLTFSWKLPDEVYLRSITTPSRSASLIDGCFLSLWHSWETPEAKRSSKTHSHTHTRSLRTLGQIPVLSGCCGTPELSKPHHNPSHGSGHGVRSQFTVRLSTGLKPQWLDLKKKKNCISSAGSFFSSLLGEESDLPKMSTLGN